MSLWTRGSGGLRALFAKRESEREMDEELRAYLDSATEANVRRGMSPAEARRAARVEMGSLESVKEGIRGAGWESSFEAFWRDIRHAVRLLRKAPVFTAVVVLTLALGIGANTAIFSCIDAILLRNLPVERPGELAVFSEDILTNPIWEQIRDRQDVMSGAFAWSATRFNLAKGGAVQNVSGLWVSGDFFRTLGLRPAAGRLLTVADDRRGCPALAVLGYGFWQDRYGGAPSAVESTISLNGQPFQIAGVAPAGFFGMDIGSKFDVAVPLCASDVFDTGGRRRLDGRSQWWLKVAGRMKPGMTLRALKARVAALSPEIFGGAVPQNWTSKDQEVFRKRILKPETASTGLSELREPYERPLHILMGVVGLVLLIACANIASLLLSRAASRAKEMAMRQALGASRGRLVRQLMTEAVLLSLAGAALGLWFARWGNAILLHYLSKLNEKVFLDFALNWRVLGFTAGTAILTGLLFGVAPAFRATRGQLTDAIKETNSGRGPRRRAQLWIVASQVALSLVLLVTAGLLLHSFWNLAGQDMGFDRRQVIVMSAGTTRDRLPTTKTAATMQEIEDRLRELPGVTAASHSFTTPMGYSGWNSSIQSDVPGGPSRDDALTYFNVVSPSYFGTMRAPLLAGRNFDRNDTAVSTRVAVVNETLARRFFPGINPVGHTFQVEGEARKMEPPVTIVGVVKDSKYRTAREKTFATVFVPLAQTPDESGSNFEIRTSLPLSAISPLIQSVMSGVNKNIPYEVHTLAAQVDDSMTRERLLAALSAFFGGLALLLAMIGLYGTLSYLVAQRRVEFGIRMAIGATSRSILGLVMRDVVALLLVGIACGIGISLGITRLLETQLYGLQPRDPVTLGFSAGLLAAVSVGASLLAARRATKVNPITALRQD
jgi:putative ABC transport system permease protein